jgi:formate dehydrogenase alpha subunit
MTNTNAEFADSDAFLIIGSNTSETHPVIGYRVRKAVRKGAKLVVADPRRIPLVDIADVHLQFKPGTDVALLNGLLNVILKEGLEDKGYIESRTEGFAEMRKTVEQYTPEYVEKITGVPAEDLIKAARLFGAAGNAATLYCMGVTQQTSGTDNVLALANLSLATGNIGKPYAGLNPLRGQNNVQGACDMGALPVVFPGYQPIASDEVRAKFSKAWGVELSGKAGLTMTEIFDAALDKQIRALYVMGENPLLTEPNVNHTRESMEALDFMVVQDIFLTETAQLADVILPAASFAEKDGTFVNTERRVQRVRRAVRPRGNSKPDWEICQLLANKLGFNWKYTSAAEIFAEISSLTPSYGGISYERLEAGGLQWPCPTSDHPGTPILHVGQFARGLGRFSAVEYRPAAEDMDDDFPFLLTTGRSLYQYHTGTMTGKSEGLNRFHREELMEINPADAARLGIRQDDIVQVVSRRGAVRSKVNITENIGKGILFMTFHFAETAANLLTNPQLCPSAKTPELKVCAVRVEKAGR